ncbi:MAG: PEP-CTERM sorting domain-containing protein [Emcibacter sp.]|nr:PEP-CTERM sorting domain-containing protein [Emcibacter sp.]
MRKKNIFSTIIIIMSLLIPSSAYAVIIGGDVTGGTSGGVFELVNPIPLNYQVGNDNQQSPNLFAFNEAQNITLTSTVAVNIGADPVNGDIVSSYYIFFDPDIFSSISGWVEFDSDIYGIITQTAELAASDFLANASVTYNSPGLRGLEAGDLAWIDGTFANRVNINFTAGSPGDYIRVLTRRSPTVALPESGIIGLFGLGLFGLVALRRKKLF